MYGGAAGGGKSDSLLMAAAQFVHVPGYSALLLRENFPDLNQPDALIPRSKAWWSGKATWNERDRRWTFPSGATITFGYLEKDTDVYQYQGAAFQFIGIDELTQHTEFRYRYLFSRLRRPEAGPLAEVPLRMRSATNPGGKGHQWVYDRFIDSRTREPGAVYVPARLADNPSLDAEQYRSSLARLDSVTRAQLEDGNWLIRKGGIFQPGKFRIAECCPAGSDIARVRSWDKGYATKGDFTAGALISRTPEGLWYVEDVVRMRTGPGERNRIIVATAWDDAMRYDHAVRQLIERPPGAGAETTADLIREMAGLSVEAIRPVGQKEDRAEPAAAQVENGNVFLVRGPWNRAFMDELATFPLGENDDQVDAFATGFNWLAERLLGGWEQGNHSARVAELGSQVDDVFGRE